MTGKALGQPFRRVFVACLANYQRIEADKASFGEGDIGLRGVRQLIRQRKTYQEAVERCLAAIETFDDMLPSELFNAKPTHWGEEESKAPGSRSSRAILGSGRGGASRAA